MWRAQTRTCKSKSQSLISTQAMIIPRKIGSRFVCIVLDPYLPATRLNYFPHIYLIFRQKQGLRVSITLPLKLYLRAPSSPCVKLPYQSWVHGLTATQVASTVNKVMRRTPSILRVRCQDASQLLQVPTSGEGELWKSSALDAGIFSEQRDIVINQPADFAPTKSHAQLNALNSVFYWLKHTKLHTRLNNILYTNRKTLSESCFR